MNTANGLIDVSVAASAGSTPGCWAATFRPSAISEISYPTQVEIGTRAATGAAVESTM